MNWFLPVLAFVFSLCLPSLSPASENERTLAVRASAVEEASPDTVMVTLAVETMAPSARESASLNAEAAEKVMKAVRSGLGANDRVETSSYSVFPVYDYDKGRREVLRGFRTVNQVMVTSGRPGAAGEILDSAIAARANRVVDVRFDLKDTAGACASLIKAAAEKAASQARAAASAFETTLAGVKSIAPSCGREAEGPVRFYGAEMKAAPTPVEPGMVRLRADIEAVYFLK